MINTIRNIPKNKAIIATYAFLGWMIYGPVLSILLIAEHGFDEYMKHHHGPIISIVTGTFGLLFGYALGKQEVRYLTENNNDTLSHATLDPSNIDAPLIGDTDLEAAES